MAVSARVPRSSLDGLPEVGLALVTEADDVDSPVVRFALQPVVDLLRREVVGYEALARFGASGTKLPGPFLYAAAEQGRAHELEAHLLGGALDCRSSLPDEQWLAVNVTQPAMMTTAVDRVLRERADLSGVVIEMTEQDPASDLRALRNRLEVHKAAGALIALDDVGAGHSGLRQLLELNPDIVKLDRGLVSGVATDPDRQAMVTSLLGLCDSLHSTMLAEGVETSADLHCLADLGVIWVQGYLIGRPSLRRHDLPPAGAAALHSIHTAGLRRQVVPSTGVPTFSTRFGAALALANGELGGAVVVDAKGAAVELFVPSADGGTPQSVRAVIAPLDLPARDLLLLALDRPAAERGFPLVMVDERGRAVSLLEVSDLLSQLMLA